MTTTKLLAVMIVGVLVATPTLSFAKARGGSGGGISNGSRGGSASGSVGSRGSRTYQENGAKPIEQSTTAKPAAAPPSMASNSQGARPTPAAQPSFFQRNPLLTGLAAGFAGSWLGHMIFGATDSSAKTTDVEDGAAASHSNGLLLLLMLAGGIALYLYMKRRRTPAPVFSGMTRSTAFSGAVLEPGSETLLRPATSEVTVTTADKAEFQQRLTDIQTAWTAQDVAALRSYLTPEMLSYFSAALAEDASRAVHNYVESVELLQAEVLEAWAEEGTDYATVSLRWSARDYTVSTSIPKGTPGYLVDGNEQTLSETREVWTFMRAQGGRWLLSAIQQ